MDTTTKQLIGWAAQMLREQDQFCRSQVPNWGSFSQEEMGNLVALEKLAKGETIEDIHSSCAALVEELDHEKLILRTCLANIAQLIEQVREV